MGGQGCGEVNVTLDVYGKLFPFQLVTINFVDSLLRIKLFVCACMSVHV